MEVNAPRGISTSRPEQSAQTEWDAKAKIAKESKRIVLKTILKIFFLKRYVRTNLMKAAEQK
jgi:hypothetical protein